MKTSPLIGATIAGALASSPVSAMAASACGHPLQSAQCVGAFSLVSLTYALVCSVYAIGALAILRGRMRPRAWRWAVLGAPVAAWCATMALFEVGGLAGVLSFPHDQSPFFFIDWFVALGSLALESLYVVACWKTARVETA